MNLEIKKIDGKYHLTHTMKLGDKTLYSEWFRVFDKEEEISDEIKEEFTHYLQSNLKIWHY